MNQILSTCNTDKNSKPSINKTKNKNRKRSVFFKFQFAICTIFAISISSYYAYSSYENNKKEAVSQRLTNNFNITTLYNDATNYSPTHTSSRQYICS